MCKIIETIMKNLAYTEPIEDVVEFYKREYPEMHPWLISIANVIPEKPWAKREYTIWDEILPSMYTMPEKVHMSDAVCHDCGEKCIELFFASPAWTWRMLCGRGGHMVICPNCPKMVEFSPTIMN